jgi:hypothetical protein
MTAFREFLSRGLCVLAGAGLLAQAQAGELILDPAKTYDAATFDVGGIRLGMAPDKAVEALKKTYGSDPDFTISTIQPGAKDPADITTVFGSTKAFQLSVFFDNRLAKAGAGDNQAYRLTYARTSSSAADHDQMKQAVIGKYGAPTFRDADTAGNGRAEHDEWCTPVAPAGGGAPKDCDAVPHLKYTNDDATIELADPGLQQRIAKKLDEMPKEKPKL